MIYEANRQMGPNGKNFSDTFLEVCKCHEFNIQWSSATTQQSNTSINNIPSYIHFAKEAWQISYSSMNIQPGLNPLKEALWSQTPEDNTSNKEKKPDSSFLDLRKRQDETIEDETLFDDKLEDFICHIVTPCSAQVTCEDFVADFQGADLPCACHLHIFGLGHRKHKPIGRCWNAPIAASLDDLLPREIGGGELWTPTSACFCNASYASEACCGVRGGRVWEAPGLASLDLMLGVGL
jgi:hypothetical protein